LERLPFQIWKNLIRAAREKNNMNLETQEKSVGLAVDADAKRKIWYKTGKRDLCGSKNAQNKEKTALSLDWAVEQVTGGLTKQKKGGSGRSSQAIPGQIQEKTGRETLHRKISNRKSRGVTKETQRPSLSRGVARRPVGAWAGLVTMKRGGRGESGKKIKRVLDTGRLQLKIRAGKKK